MPSDCDSPPHPLQQVLAAWHGTLQALAAVALPVFLAGYSCMINNGLHFAWLLLAGMAALACTDWRRELPLLLRDRLLMLALVFLGWMTLRSSLVRGGADQALLAEALRGLFGLGTLVLFSLLVWVRAPRAMQLRHAGALLGHVSLVAALVSVVVFYFFLPGHMLGERLTNLFVYGGLNAVCTGLVFGFAGLWLNCQGEHLRTSRERRWNACAVAVLFLATFFTESRGAALALACGHVGLLLGRGWRRGLAPGALFVGTAALYLLMTPLVAHFGQLQIRARLPAAVSAAMPALASVPLEMASPVRHLVQRGDSGRLHIYEAGLAAMPHLRQHLIGIGQWGTKEQWFRLLPRADPLMSHLHSAFLATYVHGGAVGASLLLAVLAWAFRRAKTLASFGDATWLALLAHGCGGLLFDGETMCSLASQPRFEALILWFPLVAASSVYQHRYRPGLR